MAAVTFRDETATGRPVADPWGVEGLPDRMTVRELIRLRVREEVARYNAGTGGGRYHGLVRPGATETELNGRRRERQPVVWERQADIAERAFAANGFFVLSGDRQVEDLDEVLDLTAGPELVFIELVPLAGG
ncbi:hypothetical protein [Streptomyces sp. NPDC020917]|uniref:hypothetical protein n=1 Tax=Streptomyces sp. NPDC020917 TaxID=3365102 RepID=UPI0037AE6F99